jgi:acyl-coenzyme A synthetase/AMP-(fatty) acid ligase/uncharacterized membrane protein/3-hydroxymyristoyl/3-hydroxydecanoyl-(acyl carrier protein) dehydratase
MARRIRALGYILAALYPLVMFCLLVILKLPPRGIALFMGVLGMGFFLSAGTGKKAAGLQGKADGPGFVRGLALSLLLVGLGLLCFITNSALFLKLYPVLVNGAFLAAFAFTLLRPPNMIFRIAVFQDKTIRGSLAEKRVEAYCRRVTRVWCLFFILNGVVAAWTVFFAPDGVWSLYNGGISYMVMGILFAGEWMIRKRVDKKMPRAVPLSALKSGSRPRDRVLCYEGRYDQGRYKTWGDFLDDTARLRRYIQGKEAEQWLLHSEDGWYFLTALAALLQCKKQVLLSANIAPEYVAEILTPGMVVLTDQDMEGAVSLPALLAPDTAEGPAEEPAEKPADEPPPINRDETVILMYTSGTTGKPKVVRQRLTEFEIDNAFILSKWGEEFLRRRVCSTVSHHHIYGLLFTILLPFTAGVPFRRNRVRDPGELAALGEDGPMIITVPAFLKRAVELDSPGTAGLPFASPWIFTSGGVLDPETARRTEAALGFWPLEVYGSTETSGIAFRQSKNGPAWTPFDDARINLDESGCLVVRSPYVKDPAGFTTGDLAELLPDGRFLLKGRADSIVKIEEKRVSLPEVEARLLASGLVADAAVIALEDRRQYLAAALVLNPRGRERFGETEKYRINRYFTDYLSGFFEAVVIPKRWRYVDALPMDPQGKKKRDEVAALFARREEPDIPPDTPPEPEWRRWPPVHRVSCLDLQSPAADTVVLELLIPGESDYFDGHFPEFKLLPAVAQLDLAACFTRRCFAREPFFTGSKRIKFSAMIRPGSRVFLELRLDPSRETLGFVFRDAGGTLFSAGTLILGKTP